VVVISAPVYGKPSSRAEVPNLYGMEDPQRMLKHLHLLSVQQNPMPNKVLHHVSVQCLYPLT
jgi:hypothetical protein